MNIEQLASDLASWLRVDTWATGHPLDDQRFHLALKAAFDRQGTAMTAEDFRQAITISLDQHQQGVGKRSISIVEKYALRAEQIACYLYDIKR
ncbi:hypothetical protein N015_08560 [Pseudomonas asturiensis]|uniref:Uncharacterized protein n=1 Tax=Pseudomonas asturiensis TaxID=1190415 RepID=A0ABX6HAM4_9PSED|nr:hypothetical protein [Pseudomonas asturiensis]QHF02458.1 hypothetical protein N015_08560 [Pseudomonas asturiensis]